MPLTKQQLLIPRVLCIGGKEGEPNDTSGNFKSGQIITVGSLVQLGLQLFTASELLLGKLCTDYPNCFKPLPWWYGRAESELPEYLSDKFGKVKRVLDHNTEFMTVVFSVDDFEESLAHYQPADEADYQEYQKQKEAK